MSLKEKTLLDKILQSMVEKSTELFMLLTTTNNRRISGASIPKATLNEIQNLVKQLKTMSEALP